MCKKNIQPQVFSVEHLLQHSVLKPVVESSIKSLAFGVELLIGVNTGAITNVT